MCQDDEISIACQSCNYRDLSLKGEGRSAYAIAVRKYASSDRETRLIWRITKRTLYQSSENSHAHCRFLARYNNSICAGVVGSEVTVDARVITFAQNSVDAIKQILDLDAGISQIHALEIIDATYPSVLRISQKGATIAFELKPKQGLVIPGDRPPCYNCLLHVNKTVNRKYSDRFTYCPLQLYHGSDNEKVQAIYNLFEAPRHNLRLFINGDLVHSNENYKECDVLNVELKRRFAIDLTMLSRMVVDALKTNVLPAILRAQQLDTIGVRRAFEIYRSLPESVQKYVNSPDFVLSTINSDRLNGYKKDYSEVLSLLLNYMLAATFKDCSIMVSFEELDDVNDVNDASIIKSTSGKRFLYCVRLIDLDVKPISKLCSNFRRYMSADEKTKESDRTLLYSHCYLHQLSSP